MKQCFSPLCSRSPSNKVTLNRDYFSCTAPLALSTVYCFRFNTWHFRYIFAFVQLDLPENCSKKIKCIIFCIAFCSCKRCLCKIQYHFNTFLINITKRFSFIFQVAIRAQIFFYFFSKTYHCYRQNYIGRLRLCSVCKELNRVPLSAKKIQR